jgi:hypothetical protein
MGSFGGIPIPDEIHLQYSAELQEAWATFDRWWHEQKEKPIKKSSIPENVKKAMDLILATPIPTYEKDGFTGKDTCYMKYVLGEIVD